jgi:hypothetical protein
MPSILVKLLPLNFDTQRVHFYIDLAHNTESVNLNALSMNRSRRLNC